MSVVRQGNNLILSANGGADAPKEIPLGDQITIANAYSGTRSLGAGVERIEFADGTVWTETDLWAKQLANTSAANDVAWRRCA